MKASFFVSLPYGAVGEAVSSWPVPNRLFDPRQATRVVATRLDDAQLADELGFDWVGCAEHHYSPGSLASKVSVVAAAITQRTRRANVCIMGALLPLNNPARVAEEDGVLHAVGEGIHLKLPAEVAARLRPHVGREVTFGIRPEDLRVAPAEAANGMSVDAVVEVVERLGSQILLDVKVGSGMMVAAVEPTVRAKVREQLRFALNPARLHFFDSQSEAAI